MRKVILTLLLAVVNNSAMAEWVEIAKAGDNIFYGNPSTIRKNGHMVKMWELRNSSWGDDFKKLMQDLDKIFPNRPPTALSDKMQVEFDCKEEKMRTLFVYSYTENMGLGEITPNTIDTGKWEPIVPGSTGESVWKFACGKK